MSTKILEDLKMKAANAAIELDREALAKALDHALEKELSRQTGEISGFAAQDLIRAISIFSSGQILRMSRTAVAVAGESREQIAVELGTAMFHSIQEHIARVIVFIATGPHEDE